MQLQLTALEALHELGEGRIVDLVVIDTQPKHGVERDLDLGVEMGVAIADGAELDA